MTTAFSGRGGDRSYSGLVKSFGRVGGPGYIPFAGASEAAPKPGQVHQSMRTKAAKKDQATRKPPSTTPSGPVTVRRVPPTVPKGTRQAKLSDISVSGGKGNSRILTRSFATRPAGITSDNPAVYPRTRIEDAIKEDAFDATPAPKSIKAEVAIETEKKRRNFDRKRALRIRTSRNKRQYPLSHSEKTDRAKRVATNISNARSKLASNPKIIPPSPGTLMPKPGGHKSDYPSEGGRIAMKYITKFGNSYKGISGASKARSTQPGWAGIPFDLFF